MKNGIIIEDLVKGSGEVCKNGNGVGKAFDACLSRKSFQFKLGVCMLLKMEILVCLG